MDFSHFVQRSVRRPTNLRLSCSATTGVVFQKPMEEWGPLWVLPGFQGDAAESRDDLAHAAECRGQTREYRWPIFITSA